MKRETFLFLLCVCMSSFQDVGVSAADPPFLRYHVTGERPDGFLGYSIAVLGDVDGDAVTDFALGAPEFVPIEGGRVLIVSGQTGQVVRVLESTEPTFGYGASLLAPGDLDGDGIADLVVKGSDIEGNSVIER